MDFTRPQGYVDALKELEGSPLIGVEIKDGHVALPMDRRKGYGYGIVDYGLNKLDHFKQVMLFDEDSNVIAHVTIKNLTRKDWLHGKNLHSSMNVNQYKKYALLAKGVVFTAEADGLTGVFVNWLAGDGLAGGTHPRSGGTRYTSKPQRVMLSSCFSKTETRREAAPACVPPLRPPCARRVDRRPKTSRDVQT